MRIRMSTRAVVYFHQKGEKDNGLNYTMKLYHHWDWYLDGLWLNLNTIFSEFKKEYESNNSGSQRELFKAIWDEGWFEMTCWYHSDTEFIYHVYFEDKWDLISWPKVFDFKIFYQEGEDHEWVWDEPMHPFSDNGELQVSF